MKQRGHFIDPRLHIEAAAAVQDDDRPGIQLRSIHYQIVLKLRQAERPIMGLAIVFLKGVQLTFSPVTEVNGRLKRRVVPMFFALSSIS